MIQIIKTDDLSIVWLAAPSSRALLCRAISQIVGSDITISAASSGKPFIKGCSSWFISLSHISIGDLLMVSKTNCGVDVVVYNPSEPFDYSTLARDFYEIEERRWVLADSRRALRLWAAKEAIGKLNGTGIVGCMPHILIEQDSLYYYLNGRKLKIHELEFMHIDTKILLAFVFVPKFVA